MENFITNTEIYEHSMIFRLFTMILLIPIIAFSQKKDYKSYDKAVSLMKKEKNIPYFMTSMSLLLVVD